MEEISPEGSPCVSPVKGHNFRHSGGYELSPGKMKSHATTKQSFMIQQLEEKKAAIEANSPSKNSKVDRSAIEMLKDRRKQQLS